MLLASCEGKVLVTHVITYGVDRLLTLVVVTVDVTDGSFEILTSGRRAVVYSCNDDWSLHQYTI